MIATQEIDKVLQKGWEGKRIHAEEGLSLFDADLLELGRVADRCRRRFHPEEIVTLLIDRNINYTNVCVVRCKFCAFYRNKKDDDTWFFSKEELLQKIQGLVDIGGTQVLLQGGLHPDITIEYYEDLLRTIRSRFPSVHIHSFSVAEITHMAKRSRLSVRETLIRLKEAGLMSIPGGGAEILVDRVKQIISPFKESSQEWLDLMETAHALKMRTTATMMFGSVETLAERVEHFQKVRDLQDRTGGFTAFIPWSFCPTHTELTHLPMPGGDDYLRTLAISRIFFDNIPNIPTGWVTEGPKVGQIGLSFGANDFGGILMEERVISATGVAYTMTVEQAVDLIRRAGKIPAQRNTYYEILRLF